jgi:hypothetical protein
MIKGDLSFKPANLGNLPVWHARPWIDAEIEIPILNIKQTFTFLVDSGADVTILAVGDAISAIQKRGYRILGQSCEQKVSLGIGGQACYYVVDAKIAFMHPDNSIEGYCLELLIAKPAKKGSKKRDFQLKIPSLLGRNILCQFRMVMDYSRHELSLDH